MWYKYFNVKLCNTNDPDIVITSLITDFFCNPPSYFLYFYPYKLYNN